MATERENFEAWIASEGGDPQTFGSGQHMHYRNSAVNNAWVAWCRRAALVVPPVEQQAAQHVGMTIAGNGAAELGALMRVQRASRLGVYPDGNPNSAIQQPPPAAQPAPACGAAEPDMCAICEALGFDPTNHHNAAKCPYCRPTEPSQDAEDLDWLEANGREVSWGEDYVSWIVTGTPGRSLRQNIAAARAAQAQGGAA